MADEISDRKAPGFWFFTGDFERDMQMLPLDAQGLWIRMMCWASDNEAHRGFIELPTGAPMTERDIASKVGKPLKQIQRCLAVMERVGTFSRDDRGCVFSRRMARDTHISEVRRIAASKRASAVERAKHGEFAPSKPPAKQEQTPTVPVPVPVPVPVKEEEPPIPPAPPALALVPSNGTNGTHPKRRGAHRTTEEIRRALGEERGKWWDAFWEVYPCRDGMNAGMDAFEQRVNTRELAVEVFHGAQRYAKQYEADPSMKLKYPQGWINGERWKDECRINTPSNGRSGFVENVTRVIGKKIANGEKPW